MNLRPVTFVLGGPFQVFPEHLWSTPLNIYQQDIFLDSFHKKLGGLPKGCAFFGGKARTFLEVERHVLESHQKKTCHQKLDMTKSPCPADLYCPR